MKRKVGLHFFLAAIFVIFFCCNKQQQQTTQQTETESQKAPTQQAQQSPPPQVTQQPETAAATNSNASHASESTHQHAKEEPPDSTGPQSQEPEQNAASNAPHFRMPAFWENPDAAGVLPPTLDPATVAPEAQAAYLIAQQKPKLLAQMPCFCYCDRFGHKSLHDCYVGTHAEHCDVCIEEAIEADQLEKQGMSPEEIRALIVTKHHPPS